MSNQQSDPNSLDSSAAGESEPQEQVSAENVASSGEPTEVTSQETTTETNEAATNETTTAEAAPQPSAESQPVTGEVESNVDSMPESSSTEAPVADVSPATPVAETPTPEATSAPAEPTPAESSSTPVKMAIGSQRTEETQAPAQPKAVRDAVEAPAAIEVPEEFKQSNEDAIAQEAVKTSGAPVHVPKSEPVPVPSIRDTPKDIEQELESIVGDISMADVVNDAASDAASGEIELESRIKGTVTRIHNDNVFFSLKAGVEGFASSKQFKKEPEVGLMTDVIVKRYNEEDGLYELAIPGASVSVEDWSEIEVGSVVEARVTGSNTGGLECMVSNIRGFIPASQIAVHRVENLGDYVNKKLTCVITEAKPKRKNLVLSHRRILEKELAEIRKETMAKLEPGSIVEGKVTRLREFGAFVDIGGVEGLAHISKLSWDRIDKPSDVLEEGQTIKVKIEKVNPETGKISLSYRDTVTHPWEGVEERYPVDTIVKGTVTRIAPFGAFVRVETGVEGLVHISELAHRRVVAVANAVKEGEEVEVKVLSVDRQSQKMGLSIKATLPVPEKAPTEKKEEPEEPARDLAVKKRRKPLKGGMDRRSDGESFGLKW